MAAVRRCRTPGKLERQDGQQKQKDQATHGRSLADVDGTLLAEPRGGHSGGSQTPAWRDMLPVPVERRPAASAAAANVICFIVIPRILRR